MTYGLWSRSSWERLHQTLALLALVSALLLTACSDDSVQDGKQSVTLEAIPCAQQFVEVEPMAYTRAWIPPTPFVSFSTLNTGYDNQSYITSNDMEIFFTKDDDSDDPLDVLFSYRGTKWYAGLEDDIPAETYYLYGYIPYISSVNASVSKLPGSSSYRDGAVLTLNGLPTVTASDVCVVVGAKNGKDFYNASADYSVTGLAPGDFTYTANDGKGNYIYLLFDHIYSGLQLSFCVDATYAALRTIKLKKVELQAYDNSATPQVMKRKVKVTIPLSAGSGSPIGDIGFSTDESSSLMNAVPIYGEKTTDPAVPLPSEGDTPYKNFFCGFMPHEVYNFKLVSTYDVYDTQMNLIRSDCKAENMLYFKEILTHFVETKRGRKYVITLTIKPTFLYMLSEPDLNSPMVVVN